MSMKLMLITACLSVWDRLVMQHYCNTADTNSGKQGLAVNGAGKTQCVLCRKEQFIHLFI
jgi:hypothetical protein